MSRKGLNYFYLRDFYHDILPKASLDNPRIFISHQKKDSDIARKIADYLENAGIDIYFDQYDGRIDRSNPESVVNAIRYGIHNSTHMLVLFSSNTFDSMWVPWEIGYAYNSPITLGILRLKSVSREQLPEYLKVVRLVSDIWDLNQLISDMSGVQRSQLLTEGRIKEYADLVHPLNQFMDSI